MEHFVSIVFFHSRYILKSAYSTHPHICSESQAYACMQTLQNMLIISFTLFFHENWLMGVLLGNNNVCFSHKFDCSMRKISVCRLEIMSVWFLVVYFALLSVFQTLLIFVLVFKLSPLFQVSKSLNIPKQIKQS